jgi:hypothetical protein
MGHGRDEVCSSYEMATCQHAIPGGATCGELLIAIRPVRPPKRRATRNVYRHAAEAADRYACFVDKQNSPLHSVVFTITFTLNLSGQFDVELWWPESAMELYLDTLDGLIPSETVLVNVSIDRR